MENNFDLGIIGGGPAGYSAAIRAAQKGLSVIVFEKEQMGGVCLNKGCIPTKTILHCSDFYKNLSVALTLYCTSHPDGNRTTYLIQLNLLSHRKIIAACPNLARNQRI